MAIHVGELTSEVIPVPADVEPSGSGTAADERPWDAVARFSALSERAQLDARRTAAEGFDD